VWPNPDDPHEPKWLDEDRAWAVALVSEENETCAGCGHPLSECTDPRNEFGYDGTAWRCHACTAKDKAAERYRDAAPGLYLTVRRR